jgi:hypothetical protein
MHNKQFEKNLWYWEKRSNQFRITGEKLPGLPLSERLKKAHTS